MLFNISFGFALLVFFSSGLAFGTDPGFHDESEVGAAIVSGNSNSETYDLKQMNYYDWSDNLVKFTARYLNARATSGTGVAQTPLTNTALSWDSFLRYERVLDPAISVFADYGLESDVFNGYVQRNDVDLGGKYFFAKSEDTTWSAEAGYRNISTHYPASQPDSNTSNVRLYSEISQLWKKTTTFKFYVEYIQAVASNNSSANYTVGQDYQLNTEPSVTVLMSQILSLKASYLFKYMNYLPQGSTATKYLDTIFTTALVAKF